MWWFGTGMFLIEVTPESLQLTAIYGFTNSGALLLLSPVIGDLIDKTARLKGLYHGPICLTNSGALLLLSPLIGDLIDKTARLKGL